MVRYDLRMQNVPKCLEIMKNHYLLETLRDI